MLNFYTKDWELKSIDTVLLDKDGTFQNDHLYWGKLAEKFSTQFQGTAYTVAVSEHPYNLSFINNAVMQDLFRPMHLLKQMYRQGISGTS